MGKLFNMLICDYCKCMATIEEATGDDNPWTLVVMKISSPPLTDRTLRMCPRCTKPRIKQGVITPRFLQELTAALNKSMSDRGESMVEGQKTNIEFYTMEPGVC